MTLHHHDDGEGKIGKRNCGNFLGFCTNSGESRKRKRIQSETPKSYYWKCIHLRHPNLRSRTCIHMHLNPVIRIRNSILRRVWKMNKWFTHLCKMFSNWIHRKGLNSSYSYMELSTTRNWYQEQENLVSQINLIIIFFDFIQLSSMFDHLVFVFYLFCCLVIQVDPKKSRKKTWPNILCQ